MAEEPIKDTVRTMGEEVLRLKAQEVPEIDAETKALVKRMVKALYENKGIGLAAPQIGVSKRVVVIDTSGGTEMKELFVLINPKFVAMKGEVLLDEGCLSLPGFRAQVRRAVDVKVEALNLKGQTYTVEGSGLLSQALQHELDHLDGILFPDRLSWWQRNWTFRKQLNEIKRQTKLRLSTQEKNV